MDHSAYVRVLLSVWVGLGLGQLVQALHKLARFKGRVDWDWIPVTWAALGMLMFIQTWWAYFPILQAPLWGIAALVAAVALALSGNRRLHAIVTFASIAALVTFIVIYSLRLG